MFAMSALLTGPQMDLVASPVGLVAVGIFVVAYVLVLLEEPLQLRKSKPVMLAAGIIWLLVAHAFTVLGYPDAAAEAVRRQLTDFGELFLFLLVAMTFVNTMEERNVFEALRAWLLRRRLSLRAVFWITGALAFVLSPIVDNMTTALVVGSVVVAVAGQRPKFLLAALVNVVVAANAGGAFSPFGDVTTLMVWQAGMLPFGDFFHILPAALVSWLVPALLMQTAVPAGRPTTSAAGEPLKPGALEVVALFVLTVAGTVYSRHAWNLPPVIGMMTGLAVLNVFGWGVRRKGDVPRGNGSGFFFDPSSPFSLFESAPADASFDVFRLLKRAEWDTLLFFYGVIMAVGGLATLGYLALASQWLYGSFGPTAANVTVGLLSSVVDNIPVMYSVLQMSPTMDEGQWLLVTLTAGIGGSLFSVGSAAGVALMGQARNTYTFMGHLRWTWAILLGFAAGVATQLLTAGF